MSDPSSPPQFTCRYCEDEADLYREAEQDEIRCALALFRSLGRDFGQYRAVKVDGALNWRITTPRTPEALLAALETEGPPAPEEAVQPLIRRLNTWERFWINRYRRSPPDAKRIEVRVGDMRKLREAYASVDTLPKGRDAKQGLAGTESGAVGATIAETPNPSPDTGLIEAPDQAIERIGPDEFYGAVGVAMFKADLGGLRIDQKINFVGNAAYTALANAAQAQVESGE